jgi:hypothetical protein
MPAQGALQGDAGAALGKFAAVNGWLKQRSPLPIWWAEFYPVPPAMSGEDAMLQLNRSLEVSEASGASVVLFWNPACRSDVDYGASACLWSQEPAGVVASPWLGRLQALQKTPGPGGGASAAGACATGR